jgi:Ala-tRNA(Pro) deacylase
MRVPQFLVEQQVRFETLVHAPAFSSQMRAKHLHVPGNQVAKAVLLVGPEGAFLAVLPATSHVDTVSLGLLVGGPVRLAKDDEVAAIFRDCECGVVNPFGTLYGLKTVLDESLHPESWIVFEGHTHEAAIRMLCSDFELLEKPARRRFAKV